MGPWVKLFRIMSTLMQGGQHRHYDVQGQVFFASADRFMAAFDFKEALSRVTIDVTQSHFWDITAIGALDKVVLKFRREGTAVDIVGMNTASKTLVDRYALHDKAETATHLVQETK